MRAPLLRTTATWAAAAALALSGVALTGAPVAAGAVPTCNGKPATIVGTSGDDEIEGTAGPDVVVAGAGRDTFYDLGGDDTICGGPGDDELDGGAGNDWVSGGPGNDHLTAQYGTDRLLGDDGDDNLAVFDSPRSVVDAGPGDDWVGARGLETTVRLGPGDDRVGVDNTAGAVLGGSGDDEFLVRWPLDIPFGATPEGRTTARLVGGSGTDLFNLREVRVPVRIDVAAGLATWRNGRVELSRLEAYHGGSAPDVLLGSERAEWLGGWIGDDVIRGRGGDDVLVGAKGLDRAYGGTGRDRCSAEIRRSC